MKKFFLVPMLLIVVALTSAFSMAPTTHAMAHTTPHSMPLGSSERLDYSYYDPWAQGWWTITNVYANGQEYVAEKSMSVGPGTSAGITESWEVSLQWSSNLGVSANGVSATVGFQVGVNYGESENCSTTNTTNQTQTLVWESVLDLWYYDVYFTSTITGTTEYQGHGFAEQFFENLCWVG